MARIARRSVLQGACAALVIGLDPLRRTWVMAAAAQPVDGLLCRVPGLDGELVSDPDVLAAAADDFGHTVHQRPIAVLRVDKAIRPSVRRRSMPAS